MLPDKTLNIYPKSRENLESLLNFYFIDNVTNRVEALELIEESNLTLNQCEFVIKMLSEAYVTIFRQHLKGKISLYNLFCYGIDALENETPNSIGSKNRQLITKEFRDFVAARN